MTIIFGCLFSTNVLSLFLPQWVKLKKMNK
jgi:hypothetical protein